MLKKLRIENFKSWRSAEVSFAPITAFFGANSSGKSSLIQFILLLKQTKDSPDRNLPLDFGNEESLVDLGSFPSSVFDHDEKLKIGWNLEWSLSEELNIRDPAERRRTLFSGNSISVTSEVGLRGNAPVGDLLVYSFGGSKFELRRDPARSEYHLQAIGPTQFRFIRTPGRRWTLSAPTKSHAFPDQARTYFQNSQFLSELELSYVKQMDEILHLGPLRAPPRRQYTWAGSRPLDVGPSGEQTIAAILAAEAHDLKINFRYRSPLLPFQQMIAWWLQKLGLIHSFQVKEVAPGSGLYRVHVRRDENSADTLITDVGFGVSQILPALVLLNYVPSGSTVILEQPEIHLHPAVQSAFADLIITVAMHRKVQLIIESHSEHILQRLLRRIAEGRSSPFPEITNKDVRLYFTQSKSGKSSLTELDVNLFGGVENWPDDFFGDQFGEVAARERAALQRRVEKSRNL